jgi:hypothetical protein
MILSPNEEDTEEQANNRLIAFEAVQDLIRKYVGV